jgi:hypothetical protein
MAAAAQLFLVRRRCDVHDQDLPAIATDVQSDTRAALAQVAVLRIEVNDPERFLIRTNFTQSGRQRRGRELSELLPRRYIEAQYSTGSAVVV